MYDVHGWAEVHRLHHVESLSTVISTQASSGIVAIAVMPTLVVASDHQALRGAGRQTGEQQISGNHRAA